MSGGLLCFAPMIRIIPNMCVIFGLVVVWCAANLPQLLHVVCSDPRLAFGRMHIIHRGAIFGGLPSIEPSWVIISIDLGRRAAMEWLSGTVPWWNYYQGVGMPLAGDMQSGALFFPWVLLFAHDWGQSAFFFFWQWFGGVAMYALLRQLGISRTAAFVAGCLFELNGTATVFRFAIVPVMACLPLLLLGVERAKAAAEENKPAWRVVAIALSLMLYAGYPESAYINGLLVAVWTAARFFQLPQGHRKTFAFAIILGLTVGLLLSAPVVVPFLSYLKVAYVGVHEQAVKSVFEPASIAHLFYPYWLGPFWQAQVDGQPWKALAGYVGAVPLFFCLIAAVGKQQRLIRLVLLSWMIVSFGKTLEIFPFANMLDLLPMIKISHYSRYHMPTIEFCFAVLTAMALNDMIAAQYSRRAMFWSATVAALILLVSPLVFGRNWLLTVAADPLLHNWPLIAVPAGFGLALGAMSLSVALRPGTLKVSVLGSILIVEAIALSTIASLSFPRKAELNLEPVRFLQSHLGYARYFSMGELEANSGAYFGIASLNHLDLPIPRNWVEYVDAKLLHRTIRHEVFAVPHPEQGVTLTDALKSLEKNLSNYEWVGVRYIMVPAGTKSFLDQTQRAKLVYRGFPDCIYELSGCKPYFAADDCVLDVKSRQEVVCKASRDTVLVRRELYFPGWRVRVDGVDASLQQHGGLLQQVVIPSGTHRVKFSYYPPYMEACVAALIAGLLLLLANPFRRANSEPGVTITGNIVSERLPVPAHHSSIG